MYMRRSSRLSGLLVTLVLMGVALGAVLYRQHLIDWWQLRDYTAPAEVASLADSAQVTEYGRRVFYVARPAVEESGSFNQHCQKKAEKTIVLGCYDGRHIYIFNVGNEKLKGVKQVTAMHEMLHAAYDRLSRHERERIDDLLKQQLNGMKDDTHVNELVAQYRRTEPNEISNELHSIMGTEVATLSPELETYYAQYFTDRKVVVAYAQQYDAVFKQSLKEISAIDAQLESLKTQIDSDEASLNAAYAELQSQNQRMEALRADNQIAAYNSMVTPYNTSVQEYNTKIAATKALIAQYNALVAERNQKEAAHNNLADSLNSNLQVLQSQ